MSLVNHKKEKTIFEKSASNRKGYSLPFSEIDKTNFEDKIPKHLLRDEEAHLPEVTEFDVVRHFTRLSHLNYSIDTNFYPLGSCTMKYNPRINEELARLDGFANTHPHQMPTTVQGNLALMYELQHDLAEISGLDAVTLQPAAGAHGEFTGLLMMRAYHQANGNPRSKVIIPDSAHGTNPASAHICGYQVITVKTGADGILHPEQVKEVMDEEVACLMVTNPSTLGLFESHVKEICDIVHDQGGLVYCDGANMNALIGVARPGDMGIDCMHYNLHKTFTTPHGGGGPGSGPVAVKKVLEPYLPIPIIVKNDQGYDLEFNRPSSIGRVRSFFGNFGMFVRALTYIKELGPEGIRKTCQMAVLNANYLRAKLEKTLTLAYQRESLHEVIFSDQFLKGKKIKTLDVAKRLIDFGFHPPTVYFPLIVKGSLMMEPTETESMETLDEFVQAVEKIVEEIDQNPDQLLNAPFNAPRRRLNETKAVREPKLRFFFEKDSSAEVKKAS
jgi:glycine dehydrogenase subunit 2